MGVLSLIFAVPTVAMRGGSKATAQTPPINAASSDEADFIKYGTTPLTNEASHIR